MIYLYSFHELFGKDHLIRFFNKNKKNVRESCTWDSFSTYNKIPLYFNFMHQKTINVFL